MSNNTTLSPKAQKLEEFLQSTIRGGELYSDAINGDPDPDQVLKVHELDLDADELFRFGDCPDCGYEIIEVAEESELNNYVFNLFKAIFGDIVAADLRYDANYHKWLVALTFKFLTDEQFKAVQDDSTNTLVRTVSSTFDPSSQKTGGVAETLLNLVSTQNMSASDISKYASISKEAKEYLVSYMFFSQTNKKKKWINGENYNIVLQTARSYNGVSYSNILATIFLDAEKFMKFICATSADRAKYNFAFEAISSKTNSQDILLYFHRYSVAKKRKLASKYGINFSNR